MISEQRKTNEGHFKLSGCWPGGTLWTAVHGGGSQAQLRGLIELRQKSRLEFAKAAALFQEEYREE